MPDDASAVKAPTYATPLDEVRLEPNPKRIRARAGGTTVADSQATCLLLGARHLPVHCFPEADVRTDLLTRASQEADGVLGTLDTYALQVEGRTIEAAAWQVAEPPAEGGPGLTGYVMFEWEAMDVWLEEDERVHGHPPHPYHRVDIRHSSRHVQVEIDDRVVADSRRPVLLFETGLPTRYYLHREDVAMGLLEPSETVTTCAYKGQAEHLHARVGDHRVEDAAWSYTSPHPGYGKIQDLVCFYQERAARLVVDGVEHERPKTYWS